MKKLVIFDLDGTLLYTLADINKSLNYVLEKHGYSLIKLEDTAKMVGHGAKNLIMQASNESGEKLEMLSKELFEVMRASNNELTVVYDGIAEQIYKLQKVGVKFALVSNKPDGATQNIYKEKLSKFNFSYVAGAKPELYPVKPDKACVVACLSELNIDKNDAVYVGDSDVDYLTAKNAEIDCISVLWGYRTKEEIESVGANNFISKTDELFDAVMKLN